MFQDNDTDRLPHLYPCRHRSCGLFVVERKDHVQEWQVLPVHRIGWAGWGGARAAKEGGLGSFVMFNSFRVAFL